MVHLQCRTGLPIREFASFDPLPAVQDVVDNALSVRIDRVTESVGFSFDGVRDRFERETEIELDSSVPCGLVLLSPKEARSMEVTAVFMRSRVRESELALEIRTGEPSTIGSVTENVELSIVRQLLEDGSESFP